MEEEYTKQSLSIGFPAYNMIGNNFYVLVKDENDQVLFGLSYTIHNGITEYEISQAKDGHCYFDEEGKKHNIVWKIPVFRRNSKPAELVNG